MKSDVKNTMIAIFKALNEQEVGMIVFLVMHSLRIPLLVSLVALLNFFSIAK